MTTEKEKSVRLIGPEDGFVDFESIYRKRERVPKWSVPVSPLMDAEVGGRLLRRRIPQFSKQDHIAAAQRFAGKASDLEADWKNVQRRAHRAAFGTEPQFHDYKISGIGREEYSDEFKDRLRALAHTATDYRAAAAAHWRAAGKRSRMTFGEVHSGGGIKKNPSVRFNSRGQLARSRFASRRATPIVSSPAHRSKARKAIRSLAQPRFSKVRGESPRTRKRFQQHGKAGLLKSRISMRSNPTTKIFVQQKSGRTWTDCASAPDTAAGIAAAGRHMKKLAQKFGGNFRVVRKTTPLIKKNPAPATAQIREAARRFESFTGHKPTRKRQIEFPRNPGTGLAIGPCLGVMYETTRDGKRERYVHEFKPASRPLLASSHDGSTLYLLGGAYRFTERGIVDR